MIRDWQYPLKTLLCTIVNTTQLSFVPFYVHTTLQLTLRIKQKRQHHPIVFKFEKKNNEFTRHCYKSVFLKPMPSVVDQNDKEKKVWVGTCVPLPKTLTLIMTKICDFCYPNHDTTKSSTPYL